VLVDRHAAAATSSRSGSRRPPPPRSLGRPQARLSDGYSGAAGPPRRPGRAAAEEPSIRLLPRRKASLAPAACRPQSPRPYLLAKSPICVQLGKMVLTLRLVRSADALQATRAPRRPRKQRRMRVRGAARARRSRRPSGARTRAHIRVRRGRVVLCGCDRLGFRGLGMAARRPAAEGPKGGLALKSHPRAILPYPSPPPPAPPTHPLAA
jgi:hypothetical protein